MKKKIQSKTTSKGRKNLQAKSQAAAKKKTTTHKKPGPKPTKKQPIGFTLLKRDEAALVKSYAVLEKKFDAFAETLNKLCYEDGDKMKATVIANKAVTAFSQQTSAFRKTLMKSKQGLKPIYK